MAEYSFKREGYKKAIIISTKVVIVGEGDAALELYRASTPAYYGLSRYEYAGYGDSPREAIINLLNKI